MGDDFETIKLEQYVTRLILQLGVPAHLRGYQYLREAIMQSVEDMELVGSVTKLLYPEISKKFHSTDQKVERAIRNAIEVSWTRGNTDIFREMFGYSIEEGRMRPTNSEYIARVADKVRLDFPE
ncbi:MAG: sporulation initiation factor Spo0A C-terminal domain-containing protein [Lachnospiraceae bacterium]|nr:sporulation initiation factor Spo0A C-terminal domain-containing protein [Lachnospiraceae bacterium]